MPRFVLLEHDHPVLHWDLMLEHDGRLLTWRLLREPPDEEPIPAVPLPDHRIDYLDYEGLVSGNRGTVVRRDTGTYEVEQPAGDAPVYRLVGDRLRGRATFVTRDGDLYLRIEPVPVA